jgi:hypothetical protein
MAPVGAPAHQSWSRRPLSSDSGAGVFRFAAVDALRSGAGAAAAALAAFYLHAAYMRTSGGPAAILCSATMRKISICGPPRPS